VAGRRSTAGLQCESLETIMTQVSLRELCFFYTRGIHTLIFITSFIKSAENLMKRKELQLQAVEYAHPFRMLIITECKIL
jgi:hypothetical protein